MKGLRVFLIIIGSAIAGFFPFDTVQADTPTVTSATANPATVSFGASTNLSWTIPGSNGQTLTFYCPPGVLVYKIDGTQITCGSATTIVPSSAGFSFANTTGTTATVRVRITPLTSSGSGYEAGARDLYVYVAAIPQPILEFKSSPTNIKSGDSVTLSWTGNTGVSGTNLQFDCTSGLTFTSLNPSVTSNIACGTIVYTFDLAGSGSATIRATNNTNSTTTARVWILPMIVSGSYDATHSMPLTFNVGPHVPIPAGSVNSFSASPSKLLSGSNVTFSWVATNTSGVNVQFPCVSGLTVSLFSTSTDKLPCGVPAFSEGLPTTGNVTVFITSTSPYFQNISVLAFPKNSNGTYDGTRGQALTISLLPPGSLPPSAHTIPIAPTSSQLPATSASMKTGVFANLKSIPFTQYLERGTSKSQVLLLQQFFSQDSALYPEKSTTGYFGPATERAVRRFQEKYGIAKVGDAGYGVVGPKTRAKLNSLLGF